MVYEVGDIVKLKKPHPCGSPETGRDGSEVNGDWKRNTKTAGIPDHKK